MGTLVTEGVVRLYVRDLLGVNSDVTMHIISSLSSMDEANRLFAISGCGGKLDALPTYNYLALTITRILCYYFIYYSRQMFCTATGETECPRPFLSIINNNKKKANSWSGKTLRNRKALKVPFEVTPPQHLLPEDSIT